MRMKGGARKRPTESMPTFFPGQGWVAYAAVARRGNILGALIILIVVGIVYLMAVKLPPVGLVLT